METSHKPSLEVANHSLYFGPCRTRKEFTLLSGLRAGDRGLYVSTGGFTKEARYEADRANVPCACSTSMDS